MAFISWSDSFLIDVDIIDDQHRRLFNLAGDVYSLSNSNPDRTALAMSLDELLDYTKYHFAHEEELMRDEDYPRYEAHKLLHEKLTAQTVAFRARFSNGEPVDIGEFLGFLYTWLTQHIMDHDKKIGTFLQMKKLKRD